MDDDEFDFESYPTAADASLASNLYVAGNSTDDALLSGLSTVGTPISGSSFVSSPDVNGVPSSSTVGGGNITINNGTATGNSQPAGIAGALSQIGNSIGSIFKNLTGGQTATVVGPNGQFVPANATQQQASNIASGLTGTITSFLPITLIGLFLWIIISVFRKK